MNGKGIRLRIVMVGDFPRDASTIGGGVESVMLYLSEELQRCGEFDVQVVTLDRWGLGQRTENYAGLAVHYVAASKLRGPFSRIANKRRLAVKISSLDPDLVHVHIAGNYAAATRSTGRPYVLTLHGIRYLEANLRTSFVDRLYRRHLVRIEETMSVKRAKYLISINPFVDESLGDYIRGEVVGIENPVADIYFSIGAPEETARLLYVGRLTPRKDILTLLEAFRHVRLRIPRAQLRLAGAADDDGVYLGSITDFIARHDLGDSAVLLGNLSEAELVSEYESSSLLVMASVLETAPMSLAQGLAAGRGVVTTDAGGCRHMVEEGVTGSVVPIEDPEALATAILTATADLDSVREMGRSARAAAGRRFRADAVAAATTKFYRRILATVI